jgi:hypothetical protein
MGRAFLFPKIRLAAAPAIPPETAEVTAAGERSFLMAGIEKLER